MSNYDASMVTATLGKFSAQTGPNRGYLFLEQDGEQILVARTMYPDWSSTHSTIEDWIKNVQKQKHRRSDKIDELVRELQAEMQDVLKFLQAAQDAL